MVDGTSPQIGEYSLDKNGEIKHAEKMAKEDYKIYAELQSEIKEAVEKMDGIYSKLYGERYLSFSYYVKAETLLSFLNNNPPQT